MRSLFVSLIQLLRNELEVLKKLSEKSRLHQKCLIQKKLNEVDLILVDINAHMSDVLSYEIERAQYMKELSTFTFNRFKATFEDVYKMCPDDLKEDFRDVHHHVSLTSQYIKKMNEHTQKFIQSGMKQVSFFMDLVTRNHSESNDGYSRYGKKIFTGRHQLMDSVG